MGSYKYVPYSTGKCMSVVVGSREDASHEMYIKTTNYQLKLNSYCEAKQKTHYYFVIHPL